MARNLAKCRSAPMILWASPKDRVLWSRVEQKSGIRKGGVCYLGLRSILIFCTLDKAMRHPTNNVGSSAPRRMGSRAVCARGSKNEYYKGIVENERERKKRKSQEKVRKSTAAAYVPSFSFLCLMNLLLTCIK